MAQWLKTLVALPENPGSVPSTHITVYMLEHGCDHAVVYHCYSCVYVLEHGCKHAVVHHCYYCVCESTGVNML